MNYYCDLSLNKGKDETNSLNFNELISCAILDNYQLLAINEIRKGMVQIDKSQNNNINNNYNKETIQSLYEKNSNKFLTVQKKELINWNKIKILSRLTIEVSEQKELFQFSNQSNFIKNFDILAVKPKNDKILESCLMSELNCDIICIDLNEKFSFMSKKKLFQGALEKGIFFEIDYGKFVVNNESRCNFISNFILLNDILKGKNLIVSSGAENLFMQRNPEDILTILETIFNVKKHIGFKMITENPIKAILRSKQRRLYKTTLGIVNNANNK